MYINSHKTFICWTRTHIVLVKQQTHTQVHDRHRTKHTMSSKYWKYLRHEPHRHLYINYNNIHWQRFLSCIYVQSVTQHNHNNHRIGKYYYIYMLTHGHVWYDGCMVAKHIAEQTSKVLDLHNVRSFGRTPAC